MKRKRSGDMLLSGGATVTFTNNLIRILVGDPDADRLPKEYHVYAFQLTSRSRFFRKALSRDWKEATEKIIRFPNDDPITFERYLSLVLTGAISMGHEIDKEESTKISMVPKHAQEIYSGLAELFILCDKLQDTKAVNYVIDAIVEQSGLHHDACIRRPVHQPLSKTDYTAKSGPDPTPSGFCNDMSCCGGHLLPGADTINLIYDNTARMCSIRRLLVDMWVYKTADLGGVIVALGEKLNKTFLVDLARCIARRLADFEESYCLNHPLFFPEDYHEYEETGEETLGAHGAKEAASS